MHDDHRAELEKPVKVHYSCCEIFYWQIQLPKYFSFTSCSTVDFLPEAHQANASEAQQEPLFLNFQEYSGFGVFY